MYISSRLKQYGLAGIVFLIAANAPIALPQVPHLAVSEPLHSLTQPATNPIPTIARPPVESAPPTAPPRSAPIAIISVPDTDSGEVFVALYNLKTEGWVGSPLKIESIRDNPGPIPAPEQKSGDGTVSAVPLQVPNERLDLLKEFGAIEYGQRIFTRGQRHIVINAYRFATSDGAYGAYLSLRQGSSTLVLKGDATSQDDKSVSLWKDKYFISLSGTASDDDESMAIVTSFANKLALSVKARSAEPQILSRIPFLERVHGSERIVMGPAGIRRTFPAPYQNILCSEKLVTGAVADYQLQEPYRERLRLLLLCFASPELANQVYLNYIRPLEEQHPAQATDSFLPQGSIFKVSGLFLLVQLKGNALLVITGAHKKASLPVLAHAVYYY
jgi:hypothetical protein